MAWLVWRSGEPRSFDADRRLSSLALRIGALVLISRDTARDWLKAQEGTA